MKKELRIFFTALMFLTRLPVPRFTDHDPVYLERSSKYFPLIGWIVGGISAIVLILLSTFLSIELAVLASIIAGILTTGAFHEDGFADVCDAFGGGWTKEKILDIMKDSRLGTYGVAGLVLMLATKFLLLKELATVWLSGDRSFMHLLHFFSILLTAHALSRLMAVLTIQVSTYAYADDRSKSKPLASARLTSAEFFVAFFCASFFFIFLPIIFLFIIPLAVLATWLLIRYFKKWIGGYTGDCLGSIQQVSEVICYLSILLLWKYT